MTEGSESMEGAEGFLRSEDLPLGMRIWLSDESQKLMSMNQQVGA